MTGATLSRFFGLHVAILPALLTALAGLHLLLIQRQGMSVPLSVERALKPGESLPRMRGSCPTICCGTWSAGIFALAVLAALAAFSPWELGKKADPFAPVPPGIRPEWYFLAAFQTLKLLPSHIARHRRRVDRRDWHGRGRWCPGPVVPFLDRRSSRGRAQCHGDGHRRLRAGLPGSVDRGGLCARLIVSATGPESGYRCQASGSPASWRPRPRGRRRRLRLPGTPTSVRPVTRPLLEPLSVRLEADDTHARRGFGCVDCHGGNAAATDANAAHDPARGYRAVPRGAAIIATCARCHSDGSFMRTFAPAQRIDQAAEYTTSVHGKRLAAGDPKVATCANCHGAHGVRNCQRCEVARLRAQRGGDLRPLSRESGTHGQLQDSGRTPCRPINTENYQKSVHFDALRKKQDLSAPTCNDCHGNHGASPPGIGAVTNVCGTCHAVFADRFASSPHKEVLDRGCVRWGSNHDILEPSDTMLGMGAGAICSTCHDGDERGKGGHRHAGVNRLAPHVD